MNCHAFLLWNVISYGVLQCLVLPIYIKKGLHQKIILNHSCLKMFSYTHMHRARVNNLCESLKANEISSFFSGTASIPVRYHSFQSSPGY